MSQPRADLTLETILEGEIALNPNHAPAYALRGLAKLSKGRDEEAAADFKKAIDLDASLKPTIEQAASDRKKQNTPSKP